MAMDNMFSIISSNPYKNLVVFLLIIIFCAIFFYPIFDSGYLVHGDSPSHHFEHDFLVKQLLPVHSWVNGWCMQDFLGYPILLYRSQLPLWLTVIIGKAPFVSLLDSYKIMILLALIFLACSMYFLISSKFGLKAASCVSFILLLQKDIYLDKILAGMWENYFAIAILLIFFMVLHKYSYCITLKKTALLGILLAVIILSHLFTAIIAFSLVFIFLLINRPRSLESALKRRLHYLCFFLIPIFGIAISFFYIYSLWETNWYFRPMGSPKPLLLGISWTCKGFFGGFERFFTMEQLFSRHYVEFLTGFSKSFLINFPLIIRDLFGVYGMWFFWRERSSLYPNKNFLTATAVVTVFSLLLFSDLLFLIPAWKYVPFIPNMLSNRFLVYAHLGLLIFAGHGLSRFFKKNNKIRRVIFVSLLALFVVSSLAHKSIYVKIGAVTFDKLPASRHLIDLWTWVAKNVNPSNTRIVYQNTVGNSKDPILGKSNIFSLAGLYNSVSQIGGMMAASPYPTERFTRTDNKTLFDKKIPYLDDLEIAGKMKDFNSRFIVSSEPVLREKLQNSNLFNNEQNFGQFSVFGLNDFTSRWVEFKYKDTNSDWVRFEDQLLELNINNKNANNWARIQVAFHPYWKARLNGKFVPIESGKYGLIKVFLEETGILRLKLSYDSKKRIPFIISSLSLVSALGVLIFGKKT